jgi:eukaryotic-like serine/threonine-protein kinase
VPNCHLQTGSVLGGRYRIESLLAVGGMGLIYAARHQTTGRAVVAKVLRPELVDRAELSARIAAEGRHAVRATHPNVVQVLDSGTDDGLPYLILERLYGATLEQLLIEPLSLPATADALVPVMNALIVLHGLDLVHRDLKPSNIFIEQDQAGRLTSKVLDFGIAKFSAGVDATASGVLLGTPGYMAPEQALAGAQVGPWTDVYALALVCVRCLTGGLPFGTRSAAAGSLLPTRVLAQCALPSQLVAVLGRALSFEPAERFGTMVEFRAALLGACQALEPGNRWPDAASVSFARDDTRLTERLERALRGSAPPAAPAAGRPRDVHTQTLGSNVPPARTPDLVPGPASLWRRRTGLAAVALGVAAVLALLSRADAGTPWSARQSLSYSRTSEPALIEGVTLESVGPPRPAAGDAAGGTAPVEQSPPATRTPVSKKTRKPNEEPAGRAQEGSGAPAAPESTSERLNVSPPPKAHPRGANRSPILE